MPKPRILLYSHDTYGLGHLRRSLAIAQSISRHIPRSRQLLVTGSTLAGAFETPPRLDTIKLPALSKRSSGAYMPRNLPLSLDQTIGWRSEMILQAVQHFQPDCILVDKAPVGVRGELLPALTWLQKHAPSTKIVLGMRDIEDAPDITIEEWTRNGVFPALEQFYDTILLYGDRSVFDPIDSYGLSAEVAEKVVECGYIARSRPNRPTRLVRRELNLGDRPFVLITAGGGGDGFALIDAAVNMFELGVAPEIHPLLVTGPLMPHQQRKDLAKRAAACGIDLVEFTPNLPHYMKASDLVVSMAGYNTVCEALAMQKRPLLVPRSQVRQEQRIRAERLAELGLARMLHPDILSAETLGQHIQDSLTPYTPAAALNMDGIAMATRVLSGVLRQSNASRPAPLENAPAEPALTP